ncbi:alpha/beta hydrolase family protein [Paraferrimonas sedimenticola]|uniref:Alpha/beta hydrolase family protein n=1 Tax=Paraferrimonas sedimenticola TaxID=375674 RepID=A0AA37RVA7_9GAMM|nr:hypothetical protein [Paraferrimonas sedimenticola]GLP96365.1 hypothetical protein GCM10007895_16710 [Paraferrimonas sedimenticola]
MKKFFVAIAIGLVSACSPAEVELPPVPEQTLQVASAMQLPLQQSGSYQVFDHEYTQLNAGPRELNVRLLSPKEAGEYPLLVFSHGFWSTQGKYDALLAHWVSHGYVVASVDHVDCCSMPKGIFNSLRYGNLGLIEKRKQDIVSLMDQLPSLLEMHGLSGQVLLDQVAITGHSFGGFTAQMFAGATATVDGAQVANEELSDELLQKVKAVVAVSPPGPMFDEITPASWTSLNKPTLVTTGSWDVDARFFPDYRLHLTSFEQAPAGDKFALTLAGADHYFGQLICRPEREVEPQTLQFEWLLAFSTAFLDHYLKGQSEPWLRLQAQNIEQISQGFAHLNSK